MLNFVIVKPIDIRETKILLSCLNWGMGHVARCIPLIDLLVKNGNTVFIAADHEQQQVFKQYFPELNYIDHKGYPFEFGKRGNFALDLFKQFKPLKNRLKEELDEVEKYRHEYGIELIISDHRYGFRSERIPSFILSHQLNLPVKWYEQWVQKMHHQYLVNFDEVWIPDTPASDLSGALSVNNSNLKAVFIGPLSRFSLYEKPTLKNIENVVIISGPKIYAQQFLDEQIKTLKSKEQKSLFILPKGLLVNNDNDNLTFHTSENWIECDHLILNSKKIISRSGYSTLMDLVDLKIPFSITPTPGQREQEYLFDLWYKKTLAQS